MSHLLLSRHVFLCRCGHHVVFLDLKRDKYLAIEGSALRSLVQVAGGWSEYDTAVDALPVVPASTATHDASKLAQQLVRRGLLTQDPADGKDLTPVRIETPAEDLLDGPGDAHEIRAHHLWNFGAAAVGAACALRWRRIEQVCSRARQRSARHHSTAQIADRDRARALATIYFRLRPLLFTARDACLFDALAMLNFMARYGLYPQWVFGVQTAPFAAHCWVQQHGVVFNDTAEHVRRYTPIMVV